MAGRVESFYDEFSRRFIEDIVVGNDRVTRQLLFLSSAIPAVVKTVLVIGSGSGQSAYFIATKVAKAATVVALDISSESIRLAKTLFHHQRIDYRKLDILTEPIEGTWDTIVLPDVYEHIPAESRPVLHARLDSLLTQSGRIVVTVPSPGKQEFLRTSGQGLQIIDETITLRDLIRLAEDVRGTLAYFNMISVWDTNDYIHAVVEREADHVRGMAEADQTPIKGWPHRSLWTRGRDFLYRRTGADGLQERWRRAHIHRRLSKRIPA